MGIIDPSGPAVKPPLHERTGMARGMARNPRKDRHVSPLHERTGMSRGLVQGLLGLLGLFGGGWRCLAGRAGEASAARMAERSRHAVSGGLGGRSERPEREVRPPPRWKVAPALDCGQLRACPFRDSFSRPYACPFCDRVPVPCGASATIRPCKLQNRPAICPRKTAFPAKGASPGIRPPRPRPNLVPCPLGGSPTTARGSVAMCGSRTFARP